MSHVNDMKREQQRKNNIAHASMMRRQELTSASSMIGQSDKLVLQFENNAIVIEAVQGPDNEPMLKVTAR